MALRIVPTDFLTVQDAIVASSPGDSIKILAGTFDGFEVDVENLKIFGCGIGRTIIAGAPAQGTSDGVVVSADRTILQGFTVQGFQASGVEVNSNNNILKSIESTASNNGFTNNGENNLIIKCVASINGGHGFEFLDSGRMSCLIRNESSQNFLRGFSVNGRINFFIHNIAKDNVNAGFFLFGTLNSVWSNTSIRNQFGVQIEFNSTSNQVIKNNVCNNVNSGIIVQTFVGPGLNVIDSNIVRNNGTDDTDAGILIPTGRTGNTIRFNKARNNFEFDIEAGPGAEPPNNTFDGNKCGNSDPPGLCT
ncbi:right-handed parallel beta-helix repeat-containing protein [Bacillus spongiae]|uniref:Right-handed parallel beta-helix repeat-containing protein n=1 Tax=Bacillus spongiae TaxID=2683610 RepID=A0ABU8H8U2_9BACI